MKVKLLTWGVRIDTRKHYVFLSVDKFDWDIINFLPTLTLNRHFDTGNYTLYASFLNMVAMLDIFRRDKFQA